MLYLIKSGDFMKVGYTIDAKSLKTRIKTYKTHNPNFEVLGVCQGTKAKEVKYHNKCNLLEGSEFAYYDQQIVDEFKNEPTFCNVELAKNISKEKQRDSILKYLNFKNLKDHCFVIVDTNGELKSDLKDIRELKWNGEIIEKFANGQYYFGSMLRELINDLVEEKIKEYQKVRKSKNNS